MIVITGATGLIGRPLVTLLTAAGREVRAITRDPDAAGLPATVDVVRGDPTRPETIAPALRGAHTLFLNPRTIGTVTPAEAVVRVAVAEGVKRIVVLAANNVDDDTGRQPSRARELNREAEAAVVASGLDWVSLRPGVFAVNTVSMWADQIRAGDVVRGPFANASWAPIHERDLVEVAAHAIRTDDLLGQRVVMTGPAAHTFAEMVGIIGGALGRSLSYQEIPPDGARRGMVDAGVPESFVDPFLALLARAATAPAPVADGVPRVLGRPATGYPTWVADHIPDFRS